MSIVFASFKHLKLPTSIKIPVTVLQVVYIYMTTIYPNSISRTTYFANLVVAWLYITFQDVPSLNLLF